MIVSLKGPIVKIITIRDLVQIVVKMILVTCETRRLSSHHVVREASTGDVSAPVPCCDLSAASVLAYVEAVFARLQQGKCDVRRVDLETVVVVQMADP